MLSINFEEEQIESHLMGTKIYDTNMRIILRFPFILDHRPRSEYSHRFEIVAV